MTADGGTDGATRQSSLGPDLSNLGFEDTDVSVPECEIIWDKELSESITSVSLTPRNKLIAIATADDEIHVLDTATGEVRFTLPGHKGGTNCVEFLSGSVLVSCGEDGKARIWNCARHVCVAELSVEPLDADRTPKNGHSVNHLTVNPKRTIFAVASGRNIVQFSISGSAGASVSTPDSKVYAPLPSTVECLKFSQFNDNLMAAYNGGITVWDLSTRSNNELQGLDFAYDGACLSVDATEDLKWIVAGCHDASVHIYNLVKKQREGVEVSQMQCGGYESKVRLTQFHPEGRWLASAGGLRGTLWDFSESPAGSVPTLTLGHRKTITCIGWQPDEPELLATCSKDGQVLLYNVEDIAVEGEPNLCLPGCAAPCPEGDDEVTAFVWGADGLFFAGHISGILRAWHLPVNPEYTTSSSEDEDGAESGDSGEEEEDEAGSGHS